MPTVTVQEKDRGRSPQVAPTNETLIVEYLIRGATNAASARDQLLTQAPSTEPGKNGTLHRQGGDIKELRTDPNGSGALYVGSVNYSLLDFSTEQTLFTFDTTGGTQNIKYSKGTHRFPTNAADLSNAINATATDVQGVDITVPQFAFTATKYVNGTNVSGTFIGTLFNLTGKTNDNHWAPTIDGITLGFNEGEALFLGAAGSRRGGGDFEINFHFAGSPNVTNRTIGSVTGISAKGWEYIWVRTIGSPVGSGTDVIVTQVPTYVYVEKVYDEADMTGTGLT